MPVLIWIQSACLREQRAKLRSTSILLLRDEYRLLCSCACCYYKSCLETVTTTIRYHSFLMFWPPTNSCHWVCYRAGISSALEVKTSRFFHFCSLSFCYCSISVLLVVWLLHQGATIVCVYVYTVVLPGIGRQFRCFLGWPDKLVVVLVSSEYFNWKEPFHSWRKAIMIDFSDRFKSPIIRL